MKDFSWKTNMKKINIFDPTNFYNSNLLCESNIIGNIFHKCVSLDLFKIMNRCREQKRLKDNSNN